MSPSQGFLVDLWPYRVIEGHCELLLLHRTARRDPRDVFWQGVSGGIEAGETAVAAAVRELREETGLSVAELYTIDATFQLYVAATDRSVTVVVFATRVAPDAEPVLSDEHDAWRWGSVAEAMGLLPFHPQRNAVRRLVADILERPDAAYRFRIDRDAGMDPALGSVT